jgi:aminoglycoside 3-N-acetyltransferase
MIAAAEIGGRKTIGRLPEIRKLAHGLVRRPPAQLSPIGLDELGLAITNLGVGEGDALMIHSAWDGMRQLQAKPSQVIEMLESMVGPNGTLIMPTGPICGSREGKLVYDVLKSPSSLGLLSESFRRRPGVKRSLFPAATVAAKGKNAELFLRDFRKESGNKAYGLGSPYWELGAQNGKVLVLGIEVIRTLTLQHCAFDVLGEDNPIADFYTDVEFVVISEGQEENWTIRRPHPRFLCYLATFAFSKMIDRSRTCHKLNLNGMKIALIDAKAFFDWHLPLAKNSGWPYWGFPRAKR